MVATETSIRAPPSVHPSLKVVDDSALASLKVFASTKGTDDHQFSTSLPKLEGSVQVAAKDSGDLKNDTDQVSLETCRVKLTTFQEHPLEKARTFRFADFPGLIDFLEPLKPKILQRHGPTLKLVHLKFREILQEIVDNHGFYSSSLQEASAGESDSCANHQVACFATPNLRTRKGGYATFLHADAMYPKHQSTVAMLNIWIPLQAISNYPLCFYECDRSQTVFSENKLFFQGNEIGCMSYDPCLQWGSFLCFVAGERESVDRILLHGAVNLDAQEDFNPRESPRKSLELRFLV